jgi:ankyrin repeat protein
LLTAGADAKAVNSRGENALFRLSWRDRDQANTGKLLVAAGARADQKSESGETPLSKAAKYGTKAAIELLLPAGGRQVINLVDDNGKTPLDQALSGNPEDGVIELLKKNGAKTAKALEAANMGADGF